MNVDWPALLQTLAQVYWTLIGFAAAFSFLKVTMSHQRLRRARIKLSQSPEQFAIVQNPDCVVFLVHGTWALRSKWHRPNSPFITRLADLIKASHSINRIRFSSFLWGGGNALADRKNAIADFRQVLSDSLTENHGVPHFIVCHSHGGNVVLRTLLNSKAAARQVAGVFFIATPFILNLPGVMLSEYWPSKVLVRLSRALCIIGAAFVGAYVFMPLHIIMPTDYRILYILAGGATLSFVCLMIGWKVSSLLAETTIPAEGVEDDLFRKLVFIRASGDEAAAALGATYIIRFAILTSWGTALQKINSLSSFGESAWKISWRGLLWIASAAAVTWLAVAHPELTFGLPTWGVDLLRILLVLYVAAAGVHALFVLVSDGIKILGGSLRLSVEVVTALLYMPFDFLSGFLLLPFAPEIVLASTRFGLAAEAAVPCQSGAKNGAFYQLSFQGRQVLNHSAYDHPDTARIIADDLLRLFSSRHSATTS